MSATTNKASSEHLEPARKRRATGGAASSMRARKARRPLGRTSRTSARRADEEAPAGASEATPPEAPVQEPEDGVDEGLADDVGDGFELDAESMRARDFVEDLDEVAEPADEADLDEVRNEQARNENAPRDSANFLAMYFREMAALDVLRPEEEFRAAQEIESLEIRVWEEALSNPTAADFALRVVEGLSGSSLPEFRGLRRAATEVRRGGGAAADGKLSRAASRSAAKIRGLDTDRSYSDALIGELERLARGGTGGLVPDKHAPGMESDELEAHLSRVRAAADAAESARSAFVKANLRLVVSIARRFNHGRMALADLIQEGNIGLMKAVERYDYRRGFRFSTYASWWIRHAISRALADKGREVRLPVHMIDAYHRLSKAKRELTTKLGRQPTADELAESTGLPAAKIEKMRTYLVDQSFSLDRPVNDEDGRHFVEFLQDPSSSETTPAERLGTEAVASEVRGLLASLKPMEADILRQRFGLDDDEELTLKEIGEKYNLSRERIRQLQEQALAKMRRALQRKDML